MTRLAIIFSLLFVTPAWAEIVLYCQDELATGIVKKNGRWQTGDFEGSRFTVKFDEKKMTLGGLKKTPDLAEDKSFVMVDDPLICKRPYFEIDKIDKNRDLIRCVSREAGYIFDFDKKTFRYSLYEPNFFSWIFSDSTPDTNVMHHGTCQKF